MKNYFLCLFILLMTFTSYSQTKILFDATKAESAGSADWVIDADSHNLGFSNGPAVAGTGSESNAQRIPTALQANITATTPETYWTGALSSWGIDCVKQGYVVESLPFNGQITYGLSTNAQDLSNYKVFVIDEPNILFTASEKAAIINFVSNGGGLCMISDHDVSDRNNDTFDSPHIWNDLMTTNTVATNPFGITFDYINFSQTSTNVANLPSNTILHGTWGNVAEAKWSAGTTMTLNTVNNSTAKGLIFKTGSSNTGTTNVMCALATYNNGKVVAIGDSSIADDGTGDPNDTLFNGYISDAAGNHQKLLMNSIIWLATASTLSTDSNVASDFSISVVPNPIKNKELRLNYNISGNDTIIVDIYDSVGREVKTVSYTNNELGSNSKAISLDAMNAGVYLCKIYDNGTSKSLSFIIN